MIVCLCVPNQIELQEYNVFEGDDVQLPKSWAKSMGYIYNASLIHTWI